MVQVSPSLATPHKYHRFAITFSVNQGHVDATVTLISKELDGNSIRLTFQAAEATPSRPSLMPYIIMKGYVTLDGASLTITAVDDAKRTFGIMMVAHTQASIDLANKPVGERVNVEVDMVGKYVEKAVAAALGGDSSGGLRVQIENAVERILAKRQG